MEAQELKLFLKANGLPVLWARTVAEENYDFEVRFDLRKIEPLRASEKLIELHNTGNLPIDPFRIADGWRHARKPIAP